MMYRVTGTVSLVKSDGLNMQRTYYSPVDVPEFFVSADNAVSALMHAQNVMVSGSNYPKDDRTRFNLTAIPLD